MAIKIIKNTMENPIERECENCNSIFSFNYQDIQVFESNNFLGMTSRNRVVVCPVCKYANAMEKIFIQGENEDATV